MPPWSLSLEEGWPSDAFFQASFARKGALFSTLLHGQSAVCMLGLRRGRQILTQHEVSLISPWQWMARLIPKGFLRSLQGEEHAHYRRLLARVLPSDLDPATLDAVRGICRHHLNCLVGTEAASSLWQAVSGIATDCLILIAYGARRTDDDWFTLERLFRALGPEHPIWEPSPEQASPYHELCELTHRLARSGKVAGGLGRLVAEQQSTAVDDTVAGNIVYAVEMGRYDLAGLLRWNVKTLSDAPCVVERIRRGAEPDLPRAVVLETLRLHQSEGLSRSATCDLDVEGFRIPKGTLLRIAVRESHRDPTAFPDPLSFTPDRFIGPRLDPDKYAPFGLDRHRCIGADLVTAIGAIFVEELVRRYRWRVLADGPEHRGPYHWEPSSRFAIAIEPAPT